MISPSVGTDCQSLSRGFEPVLHERSSWLRLASTGVGPILGGGQACETLEGSAEVTLLGETSGESNLHEGCVRGREFLAGKFEPKLANVLPDRAMMCSAEGAGQRNRMHPGQLRHLAKS